VALDLLAELALHSGRHGWDFRVYHEAARAHAAGLDPFDAEARARLTGRRSPLPFMYPPLALRLLRPLARLPYAFAYLVWLVLKLGALAWLVRVWRRDFGLWRHPAAALFLLFAFNGALYTDLATGNVSLFEQLLLWAAFAAWLRGRVWSFAVLVALSAQLKLLGLAFLGLLFLGRARRRALGLGVAAFSAVFALNLVDRPLLGRFLAGLGASDERGWLNPSTLALARDLADAAGERGLALPSALDEAVYLTVAVAVLALTARTLRAHLRGPRPDRALAVLLSTAAFALAAPRLKGYAYVLLVPAACRAISRAPARLAGPLLAVLAAFPLRPTVLPYAGAIRFLHGYLPLLAALAVFVLLLDQVRHEAARAETLSAPAPT
jgi:hypothetical protein